jgi:hypothetical protein
VCLVTTVKNDFWNSDQNVPELSIGDTRFYTINGIRVAILPGRFRVVFCSPFDREIDFDIIPPVLLACTSLLEKMLFIPLDSDKDDGWEKVLNNTPHLSPFWVKKLRYGGNSPESKRIGLDGIVRGVLIEPHYVCRDYRNLYSNFYSKKLVAPSPFCTRLHFFSESNLSIDDICYDSGKHQNKYIGYSVIQPIEHHCIGRTMIDPHRCGFVARVYCLQTKDKVTIRGAKYVVSGFPFISQSDEAMVCAHAALWGVTRYLSERHNVYAELKPFDLIQMTGDSRGRKYPHRGMQSEDYLSILTKFGSHPIFLSPYFGRVGGVPSKLAVPNREILLEIASYLESGFPVLASFEGHVINLIGHTLYPKEEIENVLGKSIPNDYGFYDSYNLLWHYIVVDDNFFPYQKLGNKSEQSVENNYALDAYSGQLPEKLGKDTIRVAVVPLPEKVFMTSGVASRIAQQFFCEEMRQQYPNYCSQNYVPQPSQNEIIKH